MAKIHINNPKQVINGGAKKYYFKVKGLGGPKGDKGDKGDTGATGPQGPQGNAATVSVGSTTTLPVGQDATVQNVGTLYNAVLNFGIPQGPRGPQGATGATGAKGDKGDQGNPGPQGEKGTNATVYVGTTSTLNPGSQATVYNSGTDSNAVLNFGIPKGEKGDTGPMPTIAQTTGQAIDQVMSQKATTDALNTKQATITSSNKLSADLVTDTSTTNKFVTAQDITNWNGKQDALTAGNNIDITDGVISTPAIVPEVVTELPTTGAEGKLYLTPKAHTTSTATGNPIEATITAQAGQLESFQLDGDTFQQSYEGKNLANPTPVSGGSNGVFATYNSQTGEVTVSGTAQTTWSNPFKVGNASYLTAGTYTLKQYGELTNGRLTCYARGNGYQVNASTLQTTFTTTSDGNAYICITGLTSGSPVSGTIKFQLEAGSTVSSFEPFVGGQPSPSPDYPQQIQTVTGVQTVSINGTNYPLDLGDIQLCGLGDDGNGNPLYKDRIYRDGEDWKVHKATVKAELNGTEVWNNSSPSAAYPFYVANIFDKIGASVQATNEGEAYSSHFSITGQILGANEYIGACLLVDNTLSLANVRVRLSDMSSGLESFKTMLSNKKPVIYAKKATATDTVITDQTLIAQLEAIRTALLENGTNTITNTATGPNLAGDMEIGYYGFNPTNRYDKWLWLDINNEYEQIGS